LVPKINHKINLKSQNSTMTRVLPLHSKMTLPFSLEARQSSQLPAGLAPWMPGASYGRQSTAIAVRKGSGMDHPEGFPLPRLKMPL
jgi:hypothetical protein